MFIHYCILVSFLFYPTTNVTFAHTACVSVKWCGKVTDVFIYSNVRSCLTCGQRHTDYRDITISMVAAPHLIVCKLQTHLEWAVESCHFGNLVLHHFASVWGDILFFWLMCGGNSGFGIWICTSPKDESRFRESPKWSPCAGWWAWCGVLNGTPATMQHTSRLHPILAVNKQQQNRRETPRVEQKFNSRLRHHS